MEEPKAVKRSDIYDLVRALEAYESDQGHSFDVKTRWFADYIRQTVLPAARRMRSGGLEDHEIKAANEFRLAEIREETAKKENEIDRLKSEARKLSAQGA